MELTAEEIRVLGCLIEKEATTPDQYPLSTNALVNACNQKTSRDPVVTYSERQVADTMLLLRPAGLARTITSGRADKHRHVLDEAWSLDHDSLAVLSVLMLRGANSAGELKTRTERSAGFASLDDVTTVLGRLAERDEPFVRNVGRAPGQSQDRWIHLLGGEVAVGSGGPSNTAEAEQLASSGTEPVAPGPSLTDRVAALEERIAALEEALGL